MLEALDSRKVTKSFFQLRNLESIHFRRLYYNYSDTTIQMMYLGTHTIVSKISSGLYGGLKVKIGNRTGTKFFLLL